MVCLHIVDVLQVEGLLLRIDVRGAREGSQDLAVVIGKPYGVEERHPLCSTRISFERCLRQREYEEVR